MWDFGPGGGFGGFWHVIFAIFWGVGQVLALVIFLGVLFLFVRFLLVATRAAHIYVAKNSPAAPLVAPARPAPAATKPAAATKPTTTTRRIPKPPTT